MFLATQNTLDKYTSIWSGNPKFTDTKKYWILKLMASKYLEKTYPEQPKE